MNGKVRRAALRIELLLEEFTAEELTEAVTLVGGHEGEDLLMFLRRLNGGSRQQRGAGRPAKSDLGVHGETRAVQELESVDAEKYQVLRDFETAIRAGKVLRTLDEYRAFAKILGKDFTPGKSRREALGRLMNLLAQMDLSAIRSALARTPPVKGEEEEVFRRLANQIISGPHDQNSAPNASRDRTGPATPAG